MKYNGSDKWKQEATKKLNRIPENIIKDVKVNDESVVDEEGIANVAVPVYVSDLGDADQYVLKEALKDYYNKNETYSREEVNNLVDTIPKFAIEVVPTLPTTQISTTTIYLIKTSETETGNLYTEYIYVNGNWEILGIQKLDLTNYYTKQEVDELISGLRTETQEAVSNLNENIISHIGDSIKHITNTERTNWDLAKKHADSTHARTDATKVEKSSTNGNIKINGSETVVYTHPSGTNPHGTTKSDVGLGNVGNFKAVSTVANQGLTDTEKSNARANIGAGTSSFSGSYNDLSNKPTIPTVGNGTVTIKQAGTSKGTFTMNQSGDTTIELTDNNTTYGVATQSANGLESAADKKKLDGIATGAEVNQNAFSNVVVGSTTISADSKTDSLTLAGSNVTITPDADNDKVTIGITKANVTSALGYTPPTTNTTYGVATSSALGLVKSGTDITVDANGNVSVNDDSHNHIISNIDGLQTALDGKAPNSHTHNYLPLSGGVLTGNITAPRLIGKADSLQGQSFESAPYVTDDTHILQLGYWNCTGAFDRATLLISSAFYGDQHGSGDIIHISQDSNQGATVQCSLARTKLLVKGTEREFYFKVDNTNKRIHLYVKVIGGNGYGKWSICPIMFEGGTWVTETKSNQPTTGLVSISQNYASASHTHNYLPLSGGTVTGEIISTYSNGFRVAYGNYGFFIRNDGANTYLMLTKSGDLYGSWNSLRPMIINNASGNVSFANDKVRIDHPTGNVYPSTNNSGSIGTSSFKWANMYATTFHGALNGNANSSNTLTNNPVMNYGWNGVNYFNINGTAGNAAKVNDTPTTKWWHIMRFNHANSTGYYTDLAIPFNDVSLYYKEITSGSVQNGGWIKVLDSLNYKSYCLPLSGGTMTGQINKAGRGSSWVEGRKYAMLKMNSIDKYSPFASIKTTNGSWEIGAYNQSNYYDNLIFSYVTDSDYSASNNKFASQIRFYSNGVIEGRAKLVGTYTSTVGERYRQSGLEIRENNSVGNAQSDIGYAPSIGFHWSQRCAGTLCLDKDAIFHFLKQDGTRATLDANINGNISGNAATTTKLATARTIFGKSFNGTEDIAGQAEVYGYYNSTVQSRFSSSGLRIRENGLVGSSQSDIGYAPSIGFFWNERVGSTLCLDKDGIFRFLKQEGTRATIDANINGNLNGSANALANRYTNSSRPTTADVAHVENGGVRHFKATSSMTTSKPANDGHILHFDWDTSGAYDTQLFISNNSGTIGSRGKDGNTNTWSGWRYAILSFSDSTYKKVGQLLMFNDSNNALITGDKGNFIWAVSSWSDRKLKKNIKDADVSALDKINQIQFKEFDFIDDKKFGKHQELGYIADELKEVFPECVVTVPQDKEKFGYEELDQVQDVGLIKYLAKSIQELSSIIKEQNQKIDTLQKEVDKLKRKN